MRSSRAAALDNLHGGWLTALVRCVVASETTGPTDALAWTRRFVDLHARLGRGGSKVFLEALGNCFAAAEDHEAAVRVHAATQAQVRQQLAGAPEDTRAVRAGSDQLSAAAFERAWRDGAPRSVADLVETLERAS